MKPELRAAIKQNLRKSIRDYILRFDSETTQPLDLLIPKERKIRSIVGGLETSMGTRVWEPMARALAENNGFEVIKDKILMPSPMPAELASELSTLISLRENKSTWLSAEECKNRLRKVCLKLDTSRIQYIPPPSGTGVDIFLKKNNKYYAYDTKTVQPNLGSIKGFNKQILEWYAYGLCKNPNIDLYCAIAFPYNPRQKNFWDYSPFNKGVLEPHVDALLEDEFWDFLSGLTNTYKYIVEIFEELNEEGFGKEISYMIDNLILKYQDL
ncbi:MAG TPA: TdeIII family type II restriction endonuclease [Candidatus Saccharimonadales bacterium]|jgi:hypothetical protein